MISEKAKMRVLNLEKTDKQNIYTIRSDVKNSDQKVQKFLDYLGVKNKGGTSKIIITIKGAELIKFTQYINKKYDYDEETYI